jgi:hypothetical protein
MVQTVEQAIKSAALYTDGRDYVVVRLPSGAITAAAGVTAELGEPFCSLIVDKNEVTLILPAEAWEDFANRLPGHKTAEKHYRLITFDVALDLNLVGFMALVSKVLADANISILPLAAFTRDHILVPRDQFETAMTALQKLKSRN